MRKRAALAVALLAVSFSAAGCDRQLTKLKQMIPTPTRCPDPIPDQATGSETPRDALGCFKKSVDDKNAGMFLSVTCRSKNASGCKQPPGAEKEAAGVVEDLHKKKLGGIVAQWEEGAKTTVYAVEQDGGDKRVTLISVCQIAIENRWAVCSVDEGSREAAEKREAAHK